MPSFSARLRLLSAATENGWEHRNVSSSVGGWQREVFTRGTTRIAVLYTDAGRVRAADRVRHGVAAGFIAPREHGKADRVITWLRERR